MEITTHFKLWLLSQNVPYVITEDEYPAYQFSDDEEAYKSDEQVNAFHVYAPDWFPINLYGRVKKTAEEALQSYGESILEKRKFLLDSLNLTHTGTVRLEPTPEVPEGVKEIFGEPGEQPAAAE